MAWHERQAPIGIRLNFRSVHGGRLLKLLGSLSLNGSGDLVQAFFRDLLLSLSNQWAGKHAKPLVCPKYLFTEFSRVKALEAG